MQHNLFVPADTCRVAAAATAPVPLTNRMLSEDLHTPRERERARARKNESESERETGK